MYIMGLAGPGWTFQPGKEMDIDWYLGSLLPAELIDIISGDLLQPEEAD